EPRVPCEEADVQVLRPAPVAIALPALDELVPKAGGRPVLDGPGGGGRDGVVLVRVPAHELVAEEQRGGRAEPTLAELRELETEVARHAQQQLEVRGAEMEHTAFDAAFDVAEQGVAIGAAV